MYKLIFFLGICSAFALGLNGAIPHKFSEKMVGCYYAVKEPYNDPQPDLVKKGIDASLCNYIIYSFVGIGSNGSVLNDDAYGDLDSDQFQHFNGRWKKNPRINVLAHMAALDDEAMNEPVNVFTDPHLREKVVNNVVDFVKKSAFNGIDLDLSITQGNVRPNADKKNLVLLLKALKGRFDKEGFILSVSVNPREETANELYDIKGISDNVKFINLMAFYFLGPISEEKKFVAHISPLYPSLKENTGQRKENIDYAVTYWIRHGAPANKLILGTTLSGLSFTLANSKKIGRGAPYTTEGSTDYTYPVYTTICSRSGKPEWNCFYDKEQQVPYFYKGNQLIAVDNVDSMKAKAEYINRKELGGIVVQYLDEDDFAGKCGKKFPILEVLNRVLRNKH